jgi:hypothetical protein
MCYQTRDRVSQYPCQQSSFKHTFSMPKNLSLPSFRTGPAFCSILTSGVISGSGSASLSFLFLCEGELTPGLVAPYRTNVVLVNIRLPSCAQAQAEPTVFRNHLDRVKLADAQLVVMGYTDRRRALELAEERHDVKGRMSWTSPNPSAASQCCEGSQTMRARCNSSRRHARALQRYSNCWAIEFPGLQMECRY